MKTMRGGSLDETQRRIAGRICQEGIINSGQCFVAAVLKATWNSKQVAD